MFGTTRRSGKGGSLRTTLRWRWIYAAFAAAVMIVPAVAMQFTNEVAWGPEDFGAAAVLMGGAWLTAEFILRFVAPMANKVIAISLITVSALAIWAHLAVGLF